MIDILLKCLISVPLIGLYSIISCTCSHALQSTLSATVVQVKDGDTVVVSALEGGQYFICRLYGIDSPENEKGGRPGQPFGKEAMRELRDLVLDQTVNVRTMGPKTYDREVCLIKKDGIDINLEMVRRGYAWAYRQYLKRPYASEYIEAESSARRERLGLWVSDNPIPPWEFRKMRRHKK